MDNTKCLFTCVQFTKRNYVVGYLYDGLYKKYKLRSTVDSRSINREGLNQIAH